MNPASISVSSSVGFLFAPKTRQNTWIAHAHHRSMHLCHCEKKCKKGNKDDLASNWHFNRRQADHKHGQTMNLTMNLWCSALVQLKANHCPIPGAPCLFMDPFWTGQGLGWPVGGNPWTVDLQSNESAVANKWSTPCDFMRGNNIYWSTCATQEATSIQRSQRYNRSRARREI